MPGRGDAGRIGRPHSASSSCDTASVNSPPTGAWVICISLRDLIIHGHVGDSRLTSTTPEARTHFNAAWALRFGEPPESAELSEDFVGLSHRSRDDGTIEISCDSIIKKVHGLIIDRPLARDTVCTSPLPNSAMLFMRNSGQAGDARATS
jgi:hypothetical protein